MSATVFPIVSGCLDKLLLSVMVFLTWTERYFDTMIKYVDFPLFCCVYSVVLIYLLNKWTQPESYRPKAQHLIGRRRKIREMMKGFILSLPIVKQWFNRKFKVELLKIENLMMEEVAKDHDSRKVNWIPDQGMREDNIRKRIKEWTNKELDLKETGKISGAFYTQNRDHAQKVNDFSAPYMYHNPLHFFTFKQLVAIESELLSITSGLISKKVPAYGIVTSGGTESLVMMLYAYRKFYPSKTKPNIVVPQSIHVAVEKGCFYMNVEMRVAKLNDKFEVDIAHMESLIDSNTILLAGSYPNFPHGIIDPIKQIAKLAKKYDTGMHIDACLGGFVAAFSKKHAEKIMLDQEGVTSVSIDHHKFGLGPKGVAAIFFNSQELRHCMYYCCTDWVGGLISTPSFQGSRSGFSSAGAWYALTHVTKGSYIENSKSVIEATIQCTKKLRKIKYIEVFGQPQLCVIAFTCHHPTISVFTLLQYLKKEKKWYMSSIHKPEGIHISVTLPNYENVRNNLAKDVEESLEYLMTHELPKTSGLVALYGAASSLPVQNLSADILKTVLAATLTG